MTDDNDYDFPNEAFEPMRERVNVQIGALVEHNKTVYRISQVLDFESIIGIEVETGRSAPLRIGELKPLSKETPDGLAVNHDIEDIADKDWQIAAKRFSIIKPFINKNIASRCEVEIHAKQAGIHPTTLYEWLKMYNAYGVLSALIPRKRGWSEGGSRLIPEVDRIIKNVIDDFYLTAQRPTIQKTINEIKRRCHEEDLKPPNPNTIRYRISRISEKKVLSARGYKEKAKNKFDPAAGKFPHADYPLSVWQIDHTEGDIILVDDEHRKPMGRPWLTLAIDVYSRMVAGYYLSLDPPSETSVAMCVAHAMLPKDEWLLLHNVDAEWPLWGTPTTIHADNAGEFRSNTFRKSCRPYDINLEFRPVKKPRYGGHIERLLGTFLKEIHTLPGTTFSNIKDRDGYDSEKHAAMTITEFEEWFVTLISKYYHHNMHSAIGMTPIRKWEIGVFGNSEVLGTGIPPVPADRFTILLDFLPRFKRTIQTFGVTIEGISYYSESLRPWINVKDNETGKKRQYIFKRDPRDISSVWFYDPKLKEYFKIPYADQTHPSMSVWELRQVKEKLKREGASSFNEHQIMRALTELRDHVEASKEKTKKARRQAQRRKEHKKKITPAAPLPQKSEPPAHELPQHKAPDLIDGDIDDFGDIA